MSQEEIEYWTRKKDEAFKALGRTKGDKGATYEEQYSQAYRKLVSLGARLKLKGKYGQR